MIIFVENHRVDDKAVMELQFLQKEVERLTVKKKKNSKKIKNLKILRKKYSNFYFWNFFPDLFLFR